MNLLVLGATGGIGQEVIRQSLEHGHTVTAFVRAPERLATFCNRIRVIQGDLLNGAELEQVLGDQDAVLSGFGPRLPISKADSNLLTDFARELTKAMIHSRIQRVVVVSTAFVFKDSIIPPAHVAGLLFFPSVVSDAAQMERVIAGSGLDWTIVRPPRLINKPRTGRYRTREEHLPPFGFTISRANVVDFVIKSAEAHLASRKIIGLYN